MFEVKPSRNKTQNEKFRKSIRKTTTTTKKNLGATL